MVSKTLFMSEKQDWGTPQWLFDELDREFHFDYDSCADTSNHKVEKYYGKGGKVEDALSYSWPEGKTYWMNPPYKYNKLWVKKALEECVLRRSTVVCLLPARTDPKWFWDYCLQACEIRFIKGRLKFKGAKNASPFPSMIVIFRPWCVYTDSHGLTSGLKGFPLVKWISFDLLNKGIS